jgi:hypothetical protein
MLLGEKSSVVGESLHGENLAVERTSPWRESRRGGKSAGSLSMEKRSSRREPPRRKKSAMERDSPWSLVLNASSRSNVHPCEKGCPVQRDKSQVP